MNKEFYVGQPVAFIEERFGSYPNYYRVTYYDRIKKITTEGFTTEVGFKIRRSKGLYTLGDLVFASKLKNHNLINDMSGKTIPTNLSSTFKEKSNGKLEIKVFKDEVEFEKFREDRVNSHSQDLKKYLDRQTIQNTQKEKEQIALAELKELREKNDKIRYQLLEVESKLERELIIKHCKKIKVVDAKTDWIVCEEW